MPPVALKGDARICAASAVAALSELSCPSAEELELSEPAEALEEDDESEDAAGEEELASVAADSDEVSVAVLADVLSVELLAVSAPSAVDGVTAAAVDAAVSAELSSPAKVRIGTRNNARTMVHIATIRAMPLPLPNFIYPP
jgi:hypothetical protein